MKIFPLSDNTVEKLFGATPKTEIDFRNILDDKQKLFIVAHPIIGTRLGQCGLPDCKRCVVKPFTLMFQGRKMVQSARKYDRSSIRYLLQSSPAVKEGINSFTTGNWVRCICQGNTYRYRVPIEHVSRISFPEEYTGSVPWSSPLAAVQRKQYIYQCHWYWDTDN